MRNAINHGLHQTFYQIHTLKTDGLLRGSHFTQGQDDPTNYSKKLREGWEAVPIEDAPEMEHLVLDPKPRFKGKVEVGGLLLCRMPENMANNVTSIIEINPLKL